MPKLGPWLRPLTLLALITLGAGCAGPAAAPPPSLAGLLKSYDREVAPYYPFTQSELGHHEYDRVLANDIGEDYRRGLEEICIRYREELRRLDATALGPKERLTYDVFAYRLERCVEGFAHPWQLLPVNQVGSWPSSFPIMGAGKGAHPFKTVRNYEDFLGRVDGFVVWMDTAIANMRAGQERGITLPRDLAQRVIPQLDAQIVDDPRTSLFYEPVRNFPQSFDKASREALEAKYVTAIREQIVPAYRRMRAFMQNEYLPRCRTSYGFAALPGGQAWYASAVRWSTTTELTPDQIYDIGLAETARIGAEIVALQAEIDANGVPELRRYGSVDELLVGYADFRISVEASLPMLFGRLPRSGFEIRAIEAFRERSMPSSYEAPSPDGSRIGVFYLNASAARAGRGQIVSRSLFLHETVPGHHLQIALQRENTSLPDFRRFSGYAAFGEGWALYSESLGDELGVYRNRRDRLDMLYAEQFRAARLVVDVGLHEKGWSKQRAIDYLPGSRENAELEVERYMAWPGQALAYKVGQLRFRALRTKAEAALGPAFDVRAFHDELLADGSLPLGVLEAKMDRWIEGQKTRRP
ncbi:MAG TPA: DUF885 domain-containing protein [Methylomirabilota bacterium]